MTKPVYIITETFRSPGDRARQRELQEKIDAYLRAQLRPQGRCQQCSAPSTAD
ncbi:MAG: hypothetical protein RR949_04500 [Oscillospiraceae bacterium]